MNLWVFLAVLSPPACLVLMLVFPAFLSSVKNAIDAFLEVIGSIKKEEKSKHKTQNTKHKTQKQKQKQKQTNKTKQNKTKQNKTIAKLLLTPFNSEGSPPQRRSCWSSFRCLGPSIKHSSPHYFFVGNPWDCCFHCFLFHFLCELCCWN